MKIEGPKNTLSISKRKPANKSGDSNGDLFSSMLGGTESSTATSETSSVQSTGNLLAIQEMTSHDHSKKQAIDHAELLLEELDRLHKALITGMITESQLHRLKQLSARAPSYTNDPALVETLQEINIRAAVELAKLEK